MRKYYPLIVFGIITIGFLLTNFYPVLGLDSLYRWGCAIMFVGDISFYLTLAFKKRPSLFDLIPMGLGFAMQVLFVIFGLIHFNFLSTLLTVCYCAALLYYLILFICIMVFTIIRETKPKTE